MSLPYSDFCKPLLSNNDNLKSFLDEIIKCCKKENLKSVEFKNDENLPSNYQCSVFQYRHKLKPDKTQEEIFSSFTKGTKSSINKAIKDGVEVHIDNSSESVKIFCQMNHVTRRKQGLPPQPTSFFKYLYEYLISKNLGFIVIAKKDNQVVAGAVYLTFEKNSFV